MKLAVLPDEHFACGSCTNCCRHWHVELLAGERERIATLAWAEAKPEGELFLTHAGKTFLAHRRGGACVFLNDDNGRCRIHEQFGPAAKPLGCQLFPFQIAPTFPGEATVIARYDCPTVRRNTGAAHAEELPALRRFADRLELGQAMSEDVRCRLSREQITAAVEFLSTLMNAFARDDHRAVFIAWTADWMSTLNVDELDRASLARTFAPLKRIIEGSSGGVKRPGVLARFAFRTLLALYLRRDEDVLDRRTGRLSRVLSMLAVVCGFGSFRGLGVNHPPGRLRRAKLFRRVDHDPRVFALHWRMVRNRLESFQFMGQVNGGKDFLAGLRSLALLYPLVLAAAKYAAFNRGGVTIEARDVDYAVAAIEHSFGRQAVLKQPFVRSLEKLLLDHDLFVRLAASI